MNPKKTIVVKPTLNCNFRCRYCYEFNNNESRYSGSCMSSDTLTGFIEALARIYPRDNIRWILHGGEPLITGARYLQEFINAIRSVNNKYGTRFNFSIQTNASLVSDDIIAILENNFDLLSEPIIGVSIDGPRAVEDKARILANGQSGFDCVMNGIKRIINSKIGIAAICVVGKHNVSMAKEVYTFLKELNPVFCIFNACYNINTNGELEKLGISPNEYAKFICEIADIYVGDLLKQCDGSQIPICYPIQTMIKDLITKISGIKVDASKKAALDSFVYLYHNGELWFRDTMNQDVLHNAGYIGNLNMTDTSLKAALEAPLDLCSFEQFRDEMTKECQVCDIYDICRGGDCVERENMKRKSEKYYAEYCGARHLIYNHIKSLFYNVINC